MDCHLSRKYTIYTLQCISNKEEPWLTKIDPYFAFFHFVYNKEQKLAKLNDELKILRRNFIDKNIGWGN